MYNIGSICRQKEILEIFYTAVIVIAFSVYLNVELQQRFDFDQQ